jgi:hydroxymethylglutaryl-CoA lyase
MLSLKNENQYGVNMPFPKCVKLVEVGARDGLQNELKIISTKTKIEFINLLSETGLSVIEAGSFVSPKWVPQLADTYDVLQAIKKNPTVQYVTLIPNLKGLEAAMQSGVTDIAVFTTASEQFSQKNTNCSVAEGMNRIAQIITLAQSNHISVRAYLSCVMGCPYEGDVAIEKTAALANELYQMGCCEISLGDTIGVGTIKKTKKLIEAVSQFVPIEQLAVHFHDTYGQALANIYAALEMGVAIVDSSVSGLGGCPYAKGATGNVATEDVLYMLNGMDIETGVDLKKIIRAGQFISSELNRVSNSKVVQAGKLFL